MEPVHCLRKHSHSPGTSPFKRLRRGLFFSPPILACFSSKPLWDSNPAYICAFAGSCSPSWPSHSSCHFASLTVFLLIQPFSFLPPMPLTLPPCQTSSAFGEMHPSRQRYPMLSVRLLSLCGLPRSRPWPPPCLLRLFFSASAKVKAKNNPRKRDRRKSS
jgi:hypothetical protein